MSKIIAFCFGFVVALSLVGAFSFAGNSSASVYELRSVDERIADVKAPLQGLTAKVKNADTTSLEMKREGDSPRGEKKKPPMILFTRGASRWLGKHIIEPKCPEACEYSEDWSRFEQAAAVVFHVPQSRNAGAGLAKPKGQIWVSFSLEPVDRYPLDRIRPTVDWEMSYRRSSEIWAPYLLEDEKAINRSRTLIVEPPKKKRKAVIASFISNCSAKDRLDYIRELMKYVDVDNYGSCLRNVENTGHGGGNDKSQKKVEILHDYLFVLAFESAKLPDYVTEKVWDALSSGAVPIYMGAPNVKDFLPAPGAAILVEDFESPAALADYVKQMRNDPPLLFERHLKWKHEPFSPKFRNLVESVRTHYSCRLCLKLRKSLQLP